MQQKYEARAKEAGVTIINMCGFDSIPADAGTLFLAHEARRRFPGSSLERVRAYMNGSGNVSGGTIASGLNVAAEPQLSRLADDPYLLVPKAPAEARASVLPLPDAEWPTSVPLFNNKAAAPFVMAAINTRVVRRSAALMRIEGHKLLALGDAASPAQPAVAATGGAVASTAAGIDATGGLASLSLPPSATGTSTTSTTAPQAASTSIGYSARPFGYSEYMLVPNLLIAYVTTLVMGIARWGMSVGWIRGLIARWVPQPGTGPSVDAMRRSWFHYNLVGEVATATGGKREVVARVAGGDGGYEETAKMLAEAGVLLATRMPARTLPAALLGGGFLTPATAFGMHLPTALNAAGLTFEIVSAGSGADGQPSDEESRKLRARGRPGPSWMDGANVGATTSRA